MKANRAFRLTVSRGGLQPAFLAPPERQDSIELVSVEDEEVVLYWNLPARDAAHLLRRLRTDLAIMSREEFLRAWDGRDAPSAPAPDEAG